MAKPTKKIKYRDGQQNIPLKDLEQTALLGESLSTKSETPPVCQNLLFDLKFFQLLFEIDLDLATQACAAKCPCGGAFYCADYSRKPRGCPKSAQHLFTFRFSFCCRKCRKRTTAVSVRFLGRRVYIALCLALMPARRAKIKAQDPALITCLMRRHESVRGAMGVTGCRNPRKSGGRHSQVFPIYKMV